MTHFVYRHEERVGNAVVKPILWFDAPENSGQNAADGERPVNEHWNTANA
jgi:hypothetical protein